MSHKFGLSSLEEQAFSIGIHLVKLCWAEPIAKRYKMDSRDVFGLFGENLYKVYNLITSDSNIDLETLVVLYGK